MNYFILKNVKSDILDTLFFSCLMNGHTCWFLFHKNTTFIHLSRQKENYEFMSELSKFLQFTRVLWQSAKN